MPEENLFEDFNPYTLAEWQQKIEKDLKGKTVTSLRSELEENIVVEAVYNRENGQVEQAYSLGNQKGWETVQEILVRDEKEDNKKALNYLNKGATSLLFYLGPDTDLKTLLKDILIEHIYTHFVTEGNGLEIWDKLQKIIKERQLNHSQINGSINIDCLENLARTGSWFKGENEDLNELKKLTHATSAGFKTVCINANLFANAGADLGQQLGIALSMAYEYIHRLQLESTTKFWFNFAIGSSYFGEIAKLRAFRRLWLNFQSELKLPESEAHIYCENSLRNKSNMDAYNNMIRTTNETMAAVIGGCDELSIKPFIQDDNNSESLESRISRNQSLIAQYEAHLDAVSDIARGSYFIENLTEALARKGWEFFKSIEAEGGYVKALKKGWLQQEVETTARAEQQAFDEGQKILIGVNRYRKDDEKNIESKTITDKSLKGTTVKPVRIKRLSEKIEDTLK